MKRKPKWKVLTGSMRGHWVTAETPLEACAKALFRSRPKSVGTLVEARLEGRTDDDSVFYCSSLVALEKAGLTVEPPAPSRGAEKEDRPYYCGPCGAESSTLYCGQCDEVCRYPKPGKGAK